MEKVLELLVKWKLAELSATDCGGDFIPQQQETDEIHCTGCKHYFICSTNWERLDELKRALEKSNKEVDRDE